MIFINSISLVLNIIAIVLSVISLLFTQINRRKNEELTLQISRQTLEAKFYESIFEEMLVTIIPGSRNKIGINNNKLTGHSDLINNIADLKKKILYFRYRNKDFYKQLRDSCTELENYLVQANDKLDSSIDATDALSKIDQYLLDIYRIVFDNYLPH